MQTAFAVKGNLFYTPVCGKLARHPGAYLVCENGTVAGIFDTLPDRYQGIPVEDYGDKLILPGLVDLHVHGGQYAYRGLGMDMELLDWLEKNAFPEESRFAEAAYAEAAYRIFVDALLHSATTRASIFATLHRPATLRLMEMLEKAGLPCFVGKVNMDRNSPDYLRESTGESLAETRRWLEESQNFTVVRPILTPRFTPSCTDELMDGLGKLHREFGTPVQSHLSENLSEIAWVQQLCPGHPVLRRSLCPVRPLRRGLPHHHGPLRLERGGGACPHEGAGRLHRPLPPVQHECLFGHRPRQAVSAGRTEGGPGQRRGRRRPSVHLPRHDRCHPVLQAAVAAGGSGHPGPHPARGAVHGHQGRRGLLRQGGKL